MRTLPVMSIAVVLAAVVVMPAQAQLSEAKRYIVHFDNARTAQAAARAGPRASPPSRAGHHGSRTRRSVETPGSVPVRMLAGGAVLFETSRGGQAALAALPGVVAVEEDRLFQRTSISEPLWRRQWYMHDPRVGTDAPVAWRYTRGEGAIVAVLDTGITPHPEFDGQLLAGYDFISDPAEARDGDGRDADPADEGDWVEVGDCHASREEPSSWHGSHVAGLVAARGGNGFGMVGMAPAAKLVPVRVLGRCGARMSDIIDAVAWASGGIVAGVPRIERRADAINLSLGGPGACGFAMEEAIRQARARGTAVIVAAGNDGVKVSTFSPANCPGVVSVGALARDGAMAWYSNHGVGVTLAAPGGSLGTTITDDVVSAVDQGKKGRERSIFAYYAGTSMAAPQVAGLVALMRSADPAISVDMITQQLVDNARPLPGPCPRGCGAGLMDAGATVDAVVEDRARPVRPAGPL